MSSPGAFPASLFPTLENGGGREDERYLWPQMLRAINEIRPSWIVGENVAGITTMVEGGVLTDLGRSPSLFAEGDGLHRYELDQPFTIERICRDLERAGYSVQPLLIPAAGVGAPHRRDRIFIVAYAANSNGGDDLRGTGEDAGESREERVQERNEIRQPGEPTALRSEVRETTAYADGRGTRTPGPGAATEGGRCHADIQPGERREAAQRDNGPFDVLRSAADTGGAGLQGENELGRSEGWQRMRIWGNTPGCGWKDNRGMLPGNRWADFPTVPPIHRGNDGLPFDVDRLTLSFGKWRTEALKAYGNAIVPQVMYEIFRAIEIVEKKHAQSVLICKSDTKY